MTLLEKIFGSRSQKIIKKINPLIKKINALEDAYGKLSDSELLNHREIFIGRFKEGESLDDLLPEAFATVREVSKRQLGLRPYDCQLIGGVALHNCQIAEMATGEGKTLVATLPIYLNSITSRTVVLVTVNDYLAQRDANWMSPLYKNLGMSVSSVVSGQGPEDRQKSYSSDVIYATNNELGFDYLRNNMVLSKTERVMEDCFYAIVDEVDSILIDEARTPLVISGPAEDTSKTYQQISQFIPQLKQQAVLEEGEEITPEQVGDFLIDEKSKQVELTDKGHDRVESLLKQASMIEKDESLYSSNNLKLLHYIQSVS